MNYLKLFEELKMPGIGSKGNIKGWINVKVDEDLNLRVSRYTNIIDEYVENDLHSKLDFITNYKDYNLGAQHMLALIILMQYLKEVKNNFDASSAGFRFEDYIAGLLHGKRLGGRGSIDFEDGDDNSFQMKFITGTKSIEINRSICDYYVIGIKKVNEVHIYFLDDIDDYYNEHNSRLNILDITNNNDPYVINFKKIDKIMDKLANKLRESVEELWNEISDLHYNVETILTGVNKKNEIIDIDDVDEYYIKSKSNISKISIYLKRIKSKLMTNYKRKGFR